MLGIPPGDFVAAWNSSDSISETASSLGLSRGQTISMARRLRGKGLALKLRRRPNIPADAFTCAWQASATTDEIAERFQTSRNTVKCRARQMRKRGIELKNLTRHKAAEL